MRLVGCGKISLAVITALFCADSLLAQSPIIVVSSPTYGQVTMGIGSGSYAPSWNVYGTSPEHATSFFMPPPYSGGCPAKGIVGRAFVSGEISCGAQSSVGGSYWLGLYGDVVPGSKVLVKLQSNLSINWNGLNQENYTYYTFVSTGSGVNRLSQSVLISGSITKNEEVSAVVVPHVNTANTIDGKVMYRLGTVYIYGGVSSTSGTNAKYSGAITGFSARYIGKTLSYYSGGEKTVRTGETLPQPVGFKVIDEITNSPVPDIPITFTLTDPNGSVTSLGTAQTESPSGIAYKAVTLGDVPGVYTITATCPDNVCVAGARMASTTVTARGKELVCENCHYTGRISRELENPFRLKVIDRFDNSPVHHAQVAYEVIRFTSENGQTSSNVNAASVRHVREGYTDYNGISLAYLKLGAERGVYVVRAHCADCLEGQEQIPTGTTLGVDPDILAETESETAADPTTNCGPCLSDCCPCTPILRTFVAARNGGGKSFTSAENENRVGLGGLLLPTCLNRPDSNVTWEVTDQPGDYIDSGTPTQPDPGLASSFLVGSGDFPVPTDNSNRPVGRALPLAYKVTARYVYEDGRDPVTSVKTVRQDEIDKCRQEYVDFGIPLTEVPRSTFTLGLSGGFVDASDVRDCYAHIFPHQRAVEFQRIQGLLNFEVAVSGGYRSPRKNLATPGASATSWHMFGKAIDIEPSPEDGVHYQFLWNVANPPKMLEKRTKPQIILKRNSGGTLTIGQETQSVFQQANWMHLGE